MPNSSEHRQKADRNQAFLNGIDSATDADWASVVAFYVALHWIERLAARDNCHHGGHATRGAYLARHTRHRAIRHHYQALYDAAHLARYGTVNQFQRAFPGDVVQTQSIGVHLAAIEQYVTTFFVPPPATSGS